MQSEKSLKKAEYLLNQDRFGEAQSEIKNYLASSPEDLEGLVILTQTHLGLGQNEMADKVVDDILRVEPSNPFILYLKAITQLQLGKRKIALKFIDSALTFNPMMVEAHATKSAVLFQEAKFEEAQESAQKGLEIDPENQMCLNQLSRSLLKLGKMEEHIQADKQALKNNPMNPHTHATVGYGELEKGNIQKAKEHFRESLRLDPNNAYARDGMLHAIKSTNFYYRWFLKYIFWMQGLRPQVRWTVIIVGYLLIRGLDTYSGQLGVFSFAAEVVIVLYMVFAISTWIIGPVSNILLRFNSFGKYLLTEREIKVANITAMLLGLSLIGVGILLGYEGQIQWYNLGFYLLCSGVAMTIVVTSVEGAFLEKSKRNLKMAGTVLGIATIVLVLTAVVMPAMAVKIFNWIIYGFIGFQFFANSQE